MGSGVKRVAGVLAVLMVLALSACSTRVDRGHSLIQADAAESYANVYFIRPNTEHPGGFADNPLLVDVNGEQLMRLGKGEYTLVRLKARDIDVVLTTTTQVRGRWEVTDMKQVRKFTLDPDQTYFILARMADGEFRGVTHIPESISLFDAKQISRSLKARGSAAGAPIHNL